MEFSKKDARQIELMGVSQEKVISEIELFKKGIPLIRLSRPATYGDGITLVQGADIERLGALYDDAAAKRRPLKFTPASGAASRMFKLLSSILNQYEESPSYCGPQEGEPDYEEFRHFISGIKDFAFYDDLKAVMEKAGLDIDKLLKKGHYKEILEYTLRHTGLDYAHLPKGLIKFHRYADNNRTPFEEHLVEAINYARDSEGRCRIHFTLSDEHQAMVSKHIDNVLIPYQKDGAGFEITYSTQKASTNTIAVDMDDRPFRDDDGRLLFRPAGHGALLENLNDLKGDIVFIKNIDNVVPDRLKETTYIYKKVLGGCLVELQSRIFDILKKLPDSKEDEQFIAQALEFMQGKLSIEIPAHIWEGAFQKKADFILSMLNRPIRVCGMVKNQGEPGGGPFWVEGKDGVASLQIVEKSQVDISIEKQKDILNRATHFNPVDLVCGLRDYCGEPFDLTTFTDPDTGFISTKFHHGKKLKALELPGLWNGAMANWNTVFIEVPIETFNPVKTVLDLLRKEHQA